MPEGSHASQPFGSFIVFGLFKGACCWLAILSQPLVRGEMGHHPKFVGQLLERNFTSCWIASCDRFFPSTLPQKPATLTEKEQQLGYPGTLIIPLKQGISARVNPELISDRPKSNSERQSFGLRSMRLASANRWH